MGTIASLCNAKANQTKKSHNIHELPSSIDNINDLMKIIPNLLSIHQSEFKRIFKQSKKPKHTKKFIDTLHNNNNDGDEDDIKLELIDDIPSFIQSTIDFDSFVWKSKSLINDSSVLSLVIIKDIIFQIQIIPHHSNRYYQQYYYNYYRNDQLIKQRLVDIEELIMIHHGSIHCLYTTINILLHIGYQPYQPCDDNNNKQITKLVLPYENLTYLDDIKFHISLKEKLRLSANDYEQYKLEDRRYILYEKLSSENQENLQKICKSQISTITQRTHKEDIYYDVDDVYLLISGFLESISHGYEVINDIITLCKNFYLISNDNNYENMLSFSQRDYPYSNALKLDVHNFQNSESYSLNIQGLTCNGTHYMYLVRDISLPRWIKDDIVDLGMFHDYVTVYTLSFICCGLMNILYTLSLYRSVH